MLPAVFDTGIAKVGNIGEVKKITDCRRHDERFLGRHFKNCGFDLIDLHGSTPIN
jgi:hypothetical protein